ncbi:tafazzin [Xylariomycetidae sp. FL0641]|nr:tafazzin [Xylariomycetidae sp. FL0641]
MPKKRHPTRYTKPPSTAPASLSLSSSSRNTSGNHDRSVNGLLASLRRSDLNSPPGAQNAHFAAATPSVPPHLRHILQIPETPAPRPRRPQRRDVNGRRAPPGPPPPRSWIGLGTSRHAPAKSSTEGQTRIQHWPLPGMYMPSEGGLIDMVLRRMALDWEQQRDWNRYYLYTMPSRLRAALLAYVSALHEPGLSAADLRLVLAGPPDEELAEYDVQKADNATLNGDVFCLDLAGSLGASLSLKELSEVLFPPKAAGAGAGPTSDPADAAPDSWDAPEPTSGLPAQLLPNLTHLSLAIQPSSPEGGGAAPPVSWKQLLSLAAKLPQLTHLSLAGWPEPSLTPNAKYARVTSSAAMGGRTVQYGGTGPYSHTLDGDWAEAIALLRRLARALYGLEHLDLTGCGDWLPALRASADTSTTTTVRVDWVRDWGKVASLRLASGYAVRVVGGEGEGSSSSPAQIRRLADWADEALAVERHIRAQRAGRGPWLDVHRDVLPDGAAEVAARERLAVPGL